jgi:hypothetical protein
MVHFLVLGYGSRVRLVTGDDACCLDHGTVPYQEVANTLRIEEALE